MLRKIQGKYMKLAMLQICSKLDPVANLEKIQKMIMEVKESEPDTLGIILPEVFYSMSDGTKASPYLVEENNIHRDRIFKLASENSIALLGGSAATQVGSKVYNRSYNIDANGEILAYYDKIHLFRIDLKAAENSVVIDEGKTYTAGSEIKQFQFGDFTFGLSICFDLRFPELYREHFKNGSNVMLVSSAFTQTTGRVHWETLLKARAIENQSYIIACNQWGKHNKKLTSYGHSIVVDPWGEVIENGGDGEKIIYFELDKNKIEKVRTRMKMSRQLPT